MVNFMLFPVNANIYAQQVITFNKQYLDKYNLSINDVNSFCVSSKVLEEFHEKAKYCSSSCWSRV